MSERSEAAIRKRNPATCYIGAAIAAAAAAGGGVSGAFRPRAGRGAQYDRGRVGGVWPRGRVGAKRGAAADFYG